MLKVFSLRQDVLARWAVIGLLILLCMPWVTFSSKIYHQSIIALLWLPALLALFRSDFRRRLRQPEMMLFAALGAWSLLVLLVQGGHEPLSKSKVPLYVALTLLGIMLAALDARWSLESQLRTCVLLGGLGAAFSIGYFYFYSEPAGRLIAIGLWDRAIMAAHAVGALAVLGACLLGGSRPRRWVTILLVLALISEVLFLALNQTRGVWLAMFAALVMLVIAVPSRLGWILLALTFIGVVGVAVFEPQLLLQRGFSYRPALWSGGLQLFYDNWLLGVGFNPYDIAVPAISASYKHPHNLFLDTAIRIGLPGLLLLLLLWGMVFLRAWQNRDIALGRGLLALWAFSSVALMTDGIGLWLKPNADWLVTWLPVALSMVLAMRCADTRVCDAVDHGNG